MEQVKLTQDQFVSAVTKFKVALSNAETAATNLVKLVESAGVIDSTTAGFLSNSLLSSVDTPPKSPEIAETKEEPAAADKTRKKKVKRVTDPDAPKRPLPAVLRFLNGVKREIRQKRESNNEEALPMSELNNIAQEAWKALPEATQQEIKSEHEEKMKEYNILAAEYKAKKAAGEGKAAATATDNEGDSDDSKLTALAEVTEETPKKKEKSKRKKSDKTDASPKKKSKKSAST